MHIVHFEIMDALSHLGYNPLRNESETGFRFNFNMVNVDTQVTFAIGDLNRLIEDFYRTIL